MLDSGVRLAAAFLPVGVPVIVGLVLAVLRRRSLPTVSGPAILGLALQLVVVIITTFLVAAASLQAFGLTPETLLPLSSALGFVVIVLQVLSWTLLLIALFRRLPSTTEPATAAPMPVPAMEQDRTPTGRHALLDDRGAQVVAEEGTTFLPVGGPRAEPSPSSCRCPRCPCPAGAVRGPAPPPAATPPWVTPDPADRCPGLPGPADRGARPRSLRSPRRSRPAPSRAAGRARGGGRRALPGLPAGRPGGRPGEDEPAEDTEYPGYLEGVDADEEPSDTGSIAAEQQEVPETAVFATAEPAASPRRSRRTTCVADEDTVEEQAEDEDSAQDPAGDEAVAEDPSDGPGDDRGTTRPARTRRPSRRTSPSPPAPRPPTPRPPTPRPPHCYLRRRDLRRRPDPRALPRHPAAPADPGTAPDPGTPAGPDTPAVPRTPGVARRSPVVRPGRRRGPPRRRAG